MPTRTRGRWLMLGLIGCRNNFVSLHIFVYGCVCVCASERECMTEQKICVSWHGALTTFRNRCTYSLQHTFVHQRRNVTSSGFHDRCHLDFGVEPAWEKFIPCSLRDWFFCRHHISESLIFNKGLYSTCFILTVQYIRLLLLSVWFGAS